MIKLSDKRLKKLGRTELLQLLVTQGEQLDKTKAALEAANERAAYQERIARLAEKAVSRLSGILEAAQLAQDQYIDALAQLKSQMGLNVVDNTKEKEGDAQNAKNEESPAAALLAEITEAQEPAQVYEAPVVEEAPLAQDAPIFQGDAEAFMQELEDQINADIPVDVDEDFESLVSTAIDEEPEVDLVEETLAAFDTPEEPMYGAPSDDDLVMPNVAFNPAHARGAVQYQSMPQPAMYGYNEQMPITQGMGGSMRPVNQVPVPAPITDASPYTNFYGVAAQPMSNASIRNAQRTMFSVPSQQGMPRESVREGMDYGQR